MPEVPADHKRKISDGAPLGTELKRHKSSDAASDTISVVATDGGSDDDDGGEDEDADADSASDTPTANPVHMLDGAGPFVFFCWADGIIYTLEESDEEFVYFTLKAAALDAWGHVAHLPKDDRYEALEDHIDSVTRWFVTVPEGASSTPGGQALTREWEAVHKAVRKAEQEESKGENGDQNEDSKAGWWYEVEAQREKPSESSPALQVELEYEGMWWVTGFRSADLEGRRAMSDLVDYLAVRDL